MAAQPSSSASTGDTKFDASQYAFFGNNAVEEVELGGLEDDDGIDAGFVGPGDEEYPSAYGRDMFEDEGGGSFTGVDDLAGAFSKLTRSINEPTQSGIISRGGSISRQSSTLDWAQDSYWPTQPIFGAEPGLNNESRWSQPPHLARFADSRLHRTSSSPQQDAQYNPNEHILGAMPSLLHRTSSYPQQEPQYSHTEPIPVPKSSFIPYPPSGAVSHSSPGQPHNMNMPSPPTSFQMPVSAQNELHHPQFPRGGMPPGPLGRSMAHLDSAGLSTNNLQQNALNSGPVRPNGAMLTPGLVQHNLQRPNGLVPPQMLSRHPQHGMAPIQHSPPQFSQFHAQMLGPRHPPPKGCQMYNPQRPSQMMSGFDANLAMPDLSDPRARAMLHHGVHGQHYLPQGFELAGMRMDNGWPRFRSKYMSTPEIENIARMQQAATQINDPYIDDYYHQACLAKKSAGGQLKHHFCPTLIRDPSSRARSKDEPHAYLQVDALGRLPFSSIRRPRPLLDVEQTSESSDDVTEKSASKTLDQEPMLAARITIEDGLCLLLDVDDIDRLLQFSQQQDGGLQLRNRRQALLEQLAESLQLVDPLTPSNNAPLSPNDDLVFLRIVSLPKGRKLLSRYLELVSSGSELARIACMAVFRHLRFIFGNLPSDSSAVETTTKLATAVSTCVVRLELSGLSACLAAIVCSSLQPPLRPLGHAAGDGASFIIKSVLDTATELLTDQHVASTYSMQNRALWQASFDAFFGLLTEYCMSKFDSVIHALQTQPAVAAVIGREMPVELLRASLPHTNEYQRKQLLGFAQRTVPVNNHSSHGSSNGPMTSESIPSSESWKI
ncbi:protein PAT1 homolog [Oryza sativa Japonica Group]|uniref:protein PAT1 homolog n=1 Tax=Oryza sativa subsp. japonica TaxID=39947 RepID=UPI0001C7D8AC|nr:protein PAT1 homolog [Oryza sativa Japonica Group]